MKPIIIPTKNKKRESQLLRVCSYSRVSRKTEDANRSLLNQIQYWTRVIDNNPNWIYVESYWDEGISGKSIDHRDDFNRMISDCRKGKIDLIVTKSVARFARNVADSLQTVRELKKLGINIIFEENNIDTRTMDSEMKLSIFSTFAQQEIISFSENMRWSVEKRMKAGKYSNGSAPYGYQYINGKLVIIEEQAKIIKEIFKDYLSGNGQITIAKKLREAGVKKPNGNTDWSKGYINYILQNEKYLGDTITRKFTVSDTYPYRQIRNQGIKDMYYDQSVHPAIIDRGTFESAITLLNNRQEYFYKDTVKNSVFKKKIYCDVCGSAYIRKQGYKGKIYWICIKHNLGMCRSIWIAEDTIKNAFVKVFNRLKQNYDYILTPMIEELENLISPQDKRIKEINLKIAETKEQVHLLNKVKKMDEMNSGIFIQKINELNTELSNLIKMKKNFLNASEIEKDIFHTKTLINLVKESEVQSNFSESLFLDIIERIRIDDKNMIFVLKQGLELKVRK